MEDQRRVEALLEEIRDLHKAQLDEYKAQSGRGIALAQESLDRQRRFAAQYKRVLFAGGLMIAAGVGIIVFAVIMGGD